MPHLMCLGKKQQQNIAALKLCQFQKGNSESRQHLYWMFLNCRPFIISDCCQSASLSPFPVPTSTEVRMVRENKDQGKEVWIVARQRLNRIHRSER